LCDPHGACGYEALKAQLKSNQTGIFLETAHPAKFLETMESILGTGKIPFPGKLAAFLKGEKKSIPIGNNYVVFKELLLSGNQDR